MKIGWVGKESAGKSQLMAVYAFKIFKRNNKWLKKRASLDLPCVPRTMAFDTPMSQDFINQIESTGTKYLFFQNLDDLIYLTQADIFINEINKFFPQRGSEPLSPEQAEFLSQGSKNGVDIYFCSQDFSQCHKQFRFLVNEIFVVKKIFSSRRPILSAPPVKWVFGLVLYFSANPDTFRGDNFTLQTSILPYVYLINKEDTKLYDTLYNVRGSEKLPHKLVKQQVLYLNADGEVIKTKERWVKK